MRVAVMGPHEATLPALYLGAATTVHPDDLPLSAVSGARNQ